MLMQVHCRGLFSFKALTEQPRCREQLQYFTLACCEKQKEPSFAGPLLLLSALAKYADKV